MLTQRNDNGRTGQYLVEVGVTASMKRPAPQVPFTDPDDLVSLEYSRSEAHRLDPSASRSREHGLGGHAVTRDHRLRTRWSGLRRTSVSSS